MPTIQLPTSAPGATPPRDRGHLLHTLIRVVAVTAIVILGVVLYRQHHPKADPRAMYVGVYCTAAGPAGTWAEADLTAYAGRAVELTAVGGTTGTEEKSTTPDSYGWLVTSPLPTADKTVTVTVFVDGEAVRTDTKTAPVCTRK
jgi:hypothetical protein